VDVAEHLDDAGRGELDRLLLAALLKPLSNFL